MAGKKFISDRFKTVNEEKRPVPLHLTYQCQGKFL